MRRKIKTTKPTQESLAYLDDLTGVYNRRYLKKIQREVEGLKGKNIPFSIVIVDIDHFKEINDTYGHIKGDEVIKEFSQFLKACIRPTDTLVRYGGDEFVCILSNTGRHDAVELYAQILDMCKNRKFGGLDTMISAGVASYPGDGKDFEELLKVADSSLYDAKRSGRGRIGTIKKKRIELPPKSYVGRREELEVLKKLISEATEGVCAAIIEGNIGMGKTRLVKEVLSLISDREILWSDCLALFEGIPYYPIREMLRYKIIRQGQNILRDIPVAYRVEIGKLVPEIVGVYLPADGLKQSIDEVGLVLDKYRLYESVRKVIETGNPKKVIVIDNMQWVDRETTEIVKYLLRSFRNHPVTFLFIYRQEEKTQVLEDFTSSLSRETKVRELPLGPFNFNGVSEIVRTIINDDPGNELVTYIFQGSGGNPLYISEVIKELSNAGYLRLEEDHWFFEKPNADIIPKSIEDITQWKYESLSKEGREILEIASVIGSFDIDILKGITEYNEGHIIGVIEKIKRVGLIRERDDKIEFQDELSRNTIYQSKVKGVKGRMFHKKIGEMLKAKYKGRERDVIEELAFHFYQGADKENGVKYCIEAGDRAKEKYANNSAVRYYTWAEELLRNALEKEKRTERIACLLKLADVLNFIGNNEEAMKDLEQGLIEAQTLGEAKVEADIRHKKATVYYNISQYQKAIDEATGCLEIYKNVNDKEGIAKVLSVIGNAHWRLGEYNEALKYSNESLKIFRKLYEKLGVANLFNSIGSIHGNLGDYNEALKYYGDSLKISRDLKNKVLEVRVFNNIGIIYGNLGDYEKSLKYFEDSLKIFRDIGNKYGEALVLNNIGIIYKNLGDYDQALKYLPDSLKIFRDIGDKDGEALVLNNTGNIYSNLGDYHRALVFYEASLKLKKEIGDKDGESGTLNNIGSIYDYLGNYEKALKYFEDSLGLAEKIKASKRTFSNLLSIANHYLNLDEKDKAKDLIDQAYAIAKNSDSKEMLRDALSILCDFCLEDNDYREFERNIEILQDLLKVITSKSFEGDVNLLCGRYHTMIKSFEKAHKYLTQALNIFTGIKEQLNIGRVYYYLGIMALAKGSESVHQKHSNRARLIFNSLGANGWKKRADKLLRASK